MIRLEHELTRRPREPGVAPGVAWKAGRNEQKPDHVSEIVIPVKLRKPLQIGRDVDAVLENGPPKDGLERFIEGHAAVDKEVARDHPVRYPDGDIHTRHPV